MNYRKVRTLLTVSIARDIILTYRFLVTAITKLVQAFRQVIR